jgi:hypothetical protein
MIHVGAVGLALALVLVGAGASAEGLAGTGTLSCAVASAAECDEAAQCHAVTLEQISVPDALRIDLDARRLTSADGSRTSPISAIEVLEAVLVLQGHQEGRGWTVVIDRASGHLVGTLADVEGSFALAGGCSAG